LFCLDHHTFYVGPPVPFSYNTSLGPNINPARITTQGYLLTKTYVSQPGTIRGIEFYARTTDTFKLSVFRTVCTQFADPCIRDGCQNEPFTYTCVPGYYELFRRQCSTIDTIFNPTDWTKATPIEVVLTPASIGYNLLTGSALAGFENFKLIQGDVFFMAPLTNSYVIQFDYSQPNPSSGYKEDDVFYGTNNWMSDVI
jgi:hypothetical protein